MSVSSACVFEAPDFAGHEQVTFVSDATSGLRAIVAIHDTTLGPALGGCRYWHYESEADAVRDALRLAHGMTLKAALADLPLGGGKAVILASGRGKHPDLLRALGRAIDRLGGRYVTAEDVGTTADDMALIATETEHVTGLPDRGGDPSPLTALGVHLGIRAAVSHRLGTASLDGVTILVQGLGAVGRRLAERLARDGARLLVSDIRVEAVDAAARDLGAGIVAPDAVWEAEADVLAPCALGGVLDDGTIPRLGAAIVAGAANNQLAEPRHGMLLAKRGILYAPDFCINAGGLIGVGHAYLDRARDYDRDAVVRQVECIPATLSAIFDAAEAEGGSTERIAVRMAEERLAAARETPERA